MKNKLKVKKLKLSKQTLKAFKGHEIIHGGGSPTVVITATVATWLSAQLNCPKQIKKIAAKVGSWIGWGCD